MEKPKNRELFFSEQVDQESIRKLSEKIVEINNHDEQLGKELLSIYGAKYIPQPIEIYIDSYGGMVYQCYGLISIMEKSKTPIHTIVTGAAMSCGFVISLFGHKRFCHKYSTFMYHQISTFEYGKLKDIQESIEETKRLQAILEAETLNKTKITKKKLKEIFETKKDWYISSSEAKNLGIVDEII